MRVCVCVRMERRQQVSNVFVGFVKYSSGSAHEIALIYSLMFSFEVKESICFTCGREKRNQKKNEAYCEITCPTIELLRSIAFSEEIFQTFKNVRCSHRTQATEKPGPESVQTVLTVARRCQRNGNTKVAQAKERRNTIPQRIHITHSIPS